MRTLPPTLAHALRARSLDAGSHPAFRTLVSGGAREEECWSWSEWERDANRIAAALQRLGVGPGDRVAILAGNSPVWPLADLAALRLGVVSVGVYPTSSPEQVGQVLADAGARVVFVDSEEQAAKVREVGGRLDALKAMVLACDVATRPSETPHAVPETRLDDLLREPADSICDVPLPDPDDDAILIYTSGSTGRPKGARISHRTLVASAAAIAQTLSLRRSDRALSYLPFCHAAERITGQATRILLGMEAGLVADPARVFEAAAQFRPTFFGGLPRSYEKMWEAELAERGPGAPSPSPVIERMTGGAVRVATSGGAALPFEVATGLERLGLTALGAYGLTEHLCCAFNPPGDHRFDDVGPAMPGTELRIAGDGEILVRRSDLTFSGYHANPEASRAAFTDDGRWLRTGDLGILSDDGRLRVTGRKKELIALSTGKKVAPILIESRLVEQPWIDRAVLIGEGRKYIGALLTLRRPVVEAWARAEGLDLPWPDLVGDPRVRTRVARQVDAVNATVSRAESVRRFEIIDPPFSVATGELTPTHKARRAVIEESRAHAIAALYARSTS